MPEDTKTEEPTFPESCSPDSKLDRYGLFARLRDLWVQEGHGANYSAMAKTLGVQRQHVTQWATGSGARGPAPWHVINRLLFDLKSVVIIDPVRGLIVHRNLIPAPADTDMVG